MIGYVTIGTNDLPRAVAFYDALLGDLGASRMMETDHSVVWFIAPDKPAISVTKPYDEKEATVGNGMMVALLVDSNEKVDAMHKRALELGGSDEGGPGERGMPGFYAAYFRDPDGNKLNFYCFQPAA